MREWMPKRILDAYKLDDAGWENRIGLFWAEQAGMFQESAELEYMRLAQV